MGLAQWLGLGSAINEGAEGASKLIRETREAITGEGTELRKLELATKLQEAEFKIRQIRAAHASVFVAGARPAILWVCALALFYQFLFRPIATGFGAPMPDVDIEGLVTIGALGGGFGALRSWEKGKGVQDRH